MSDGERTALIAGCSGEICIRYRIPASIAAATLATTANSATAQQSATQAPTPVTTDSAAGTDYSDIVVGGAARITHAHHDAISKRRASHHRQDADTSPSEADGSAQDAPGA